MIRFKIDVGALMRRFKMHHQADGVCVRHSIKKGDKKSNKIETSAVVARKHLTTQ